NRSPQISRVEVANSSLDGAIIACSPEPIALTENSFADCGETGPTNRKVIARQSASATGGLGVLWERSRVTGRAAPHTREVAPQPPRLSGLIVTRKQQQPRPQELVRIKPLIANHSPKIGRQLFLHIRIWQPT